jgi:CxxC motif-containing protein
MAKKSMICVICPIGCELAAEYEGKNLVSVSGNECRRGEKYADDEIQNPRRVLTSTIVLDDRGAKRKLLPVKTDKPIAKDKIFDAMKTINGIKIDMTGKTEKIRMGDVVFPDFTESGINLVAGRDIEA